MLPPSRPILRVANPGSCTDRAEPNAKLQCLRSRSPSVERSVQHRNTIDCPSPAPTGNSIFNSISTSTAERTADPLQDAGERITPPCDAMPKPSLASPNGAIRNASLNRGSAKGAATPLKLSSSDVRPSARPELVSPLYARSRSQSRAQQKASSISPKRRQEEMMEQQFRAAAWLRDKSISPQILDNKAQNYARFTSRHSPSPPPLPPNPPGWLVSAISPKQSVSRSDPITQRNSGAGLGGDLSYHRNAIDDSSLDDLRLAASIPLPRGSSSASPVPEPIETNSHRKSSTPIEFEPAVPIKSRSSRSPTCDNEQTKRLSPPLETPSKKLVLQSSGRLNSLREKKHRKTRFIKSKKMMSLLMDGMVTAESASIAKTSDISSMQASLTTQRQHVSSQNRIKSMLSNVGSLRLSSVILVVMACLMIVMRVCFAPPAQRPIPDIEKLIDLARSLEPMIYYSDDGIRQLKHLQSAELAVWDLSESIRSTNMTSAMLISQELDDLSVNMKTLGTELTRFFAMVDGDIDTVLGTMEWARRQLETLTRLPSPDKSLIVSVVDGVHSFFGRVAVLDIVNPDLLEKHLESLGKGDRNDLNSRGWALPMKSLSPRSVFAP
ncbi:hypothetical protein KEM54_003360 [Ascosphaera aggregata]|nr:hypothetical protein KEM54_003360 [Ascosphaera aggregata]